ncbi:Secreted protein [Candidatus Magnetomoraceae bacterium gMMP-1]
MYNRIRIFFFSVLPICLLLIGGSAWGEEVKLTDKSVDFYGYGSEFKAGDIITAYDPDVVLCGRFVVEEDGRYGIIHVYADDIITPTDEGALAGDVISFYVNGVKIFPKNMDKAVWTSDGASIRLDF